MINKHRARIVSLKFLRYNFLWHNDNILRHAANVKKVKDKNQPKAETEIQKLEGCYS